MTTVTIPKEITKGEELVVLPRKLYERFLRLVKRQARAAPVSTLNRGLTEALEDLRMGRVIGPFTSVSAGLRALKRSK